MKTFCQFLIIVCVAIMAIAYEPCSAQQQRINIITHAITSSSCTIGITELNNGIITSCTVQIARANSPGAFSTFPSTDIMITQATLTTQIPRTTFSLPAGTTARLNVITIAPTTSAAWCNGSWSSPYFISNPLPSLQAEITDSRIDPRANTTFLEPMLQDSLTHVIAAGSVVLLPVFPSPLRLAIALDTVLTILSRQGFALRDAWVRDFHIGSCQGEEPVFGTANNIYALIRLQRPSAGFFSALAATWSSSSRGLPAGISAGLGSSWVTTIRETLSSTNKFSRYYNFSTTATSARGTQQESGLAVRVSPQPLSGAGLLTLTAQRPLTADVRVVNMLGQTVAVLAERRLFSLGETAIPCSVDALSGGVYAVQVIEQGRVLLTQAVVVAR
jgi:hypothetical protein